MPAHRKAARGPQTTAPRIGRTPSLLDRWPFRRKLNILVIVPLAVVSAMMAYIVYSEIGLARSAADTARLVRDSAQVTKLIDGVQSEHRQALLVSLRYEAARPGDKAPDTSSYLQAQQKVAIQAEAVRSIYGDRLPDAEAQALKELEGLDSLRKTIEEGPIPADNIDPAYGSVIEGLINGLGLGQSGDDSSESAGNLLDALLRADTAHASFETSVFAARTRDPNALIEYTGAVGDYEQYTYQAERFTRFASQEQGAELASIEHSPFQSVIAQHYAALQVDPSGLVAGNAAQLRAALGDALAADPTYERQAQNRLKITESVIHEIASDTQEASGDAWWQVIWLVSANLAAFAAWILFSVLIRRSVVRTVRTLTEAAQHVAAAAETELARVADDDADDASPPRLEAVPVPVRDEIGELAEAFNQVQVTATALLERQVISRRNIAEMFGNVGHRVSNLTARQLALIDSVERGETDPEVLDRLYRIDHIAVRLQRNADSLMLLAGIRETGLNTGPMRLSNIVRAALGQIEGYQRVTPHAEGDVTVAPDIVGDLTLMLAELLENAVTFSPASSSVEVVLRPRHGSGGGALIEIIDHGLGMSVERLEEENARLIRRERLDLAPTEVLGLFVVGGLSRRWGIEVVLTRTPGGGVTATVAVPSSHLLLADPTGAAVRAPHILPPPRRSGGTEPRPAAVDPEPGPSALPRRIPARGRGTESGHTGRQEPTGDSGVGGYGGPGVSRPRPVGASGATAPRTPAGTGAGAREAAGRGMPQGAAGGPGPQRGTGTGPNTGTGTGSGVGRPSRGAGTAPGSGTAPSTSGSAPARPGEGGASPLRRRVRGATLQATTASTRLPKQTITNPRPPAWQTADAEAARSEIDEFEAAVLRAERDSAAEAHSTGIGSAHSGGRPDTSNESSTENNRPSFPEGMSK
ncbi:HAMP domain-containing protein [Streptomyces sp. NBC_01136]|uniref:sensor histidine kinase n=1 Tax=Streptomyces sp. NBC_01136 TaxID=2903754 RepID=UPI003866A245|nr:HAMP domain-containing protein [Streptomyces sp. NBC_01136]